MINLKLGGIALRFNQFVLIKTCTLIIQIKEAHMAHCMFI